MATKAGVAGALDGSRPPVPKLACFLPEGSPTHWTLLIRNHRLLVRGNSGTNVLFVAIAVVGSRPSRARSALRRTDGTQQAGICEQEL